MRDIPGITPLRALAAMLVLVSHVAFWSGASGVDGVGRLLARGDAGVAVFFAISAYLLLRPALLPTRSWPPTRYATRRMARIAPAYWVALLAVLAVASTTTAGVGGPLRVLDHVLLLQGFTQNPYQGFTQTWSLTTEASFYLLVPLIGILLRRAVVRDVPTHRVLRLLGVVGGGAVLLQAWSASRGAPAFGALSTSVVGHAAWFAVGLAVLWWHRHGDEGPARRLSPAQACGVAVTTYVLAATPLGGPVGLTHPGIVAAGAKELLYTVIAGCLVHAACCRPTGRAAAIITSPLAQRAGDMSYGFFLWHVLVIQVLFLGLGLPLFHTSFVFVLVPTVVFSGALAWCSWQFVEQPAIAWAHRRKPTGTPSGS